MNQIRRQGLLQEGRRNRWEIITPEGDHFHVLTKIASTFCMPGQIQEVFFSEGERQKNMRIHQAEDVSLTFFKNHLPEKD